MLPPGSASTTTCAGSASRRRSRPTSGGSPAGRTCSRRHSGCPMLDPMTTTFGFTPGQPPEWDLERFMRGDEVDTAVITLERNRLTFAWKCADVDGDGLRLRVGASSVTLGGLLRHLAWVEELYFQNRLADRTSMAPF